MQVSLFLPVVTIISIFFSSLILSVTQVAYAQNAVAGIGLSPATIEESLDPGETKRYTVNISNLSESDQTYYLYVRNIVGVTGGGVPEYAREGAEKTGFELSEWVALDVSELVVPVGAQAPLSFTINVPESASPGSHFGAIFVSVEPPRMRNTGAAVGYEVANIISIRVAGDAVEKAEIRQFSTDRYLYGSTDITFALRIENLGNTLVRPVGPLQITNMFGKQVALLTFNDSLAGVFPGVVREFSFNWKDEGFGFGRYEARVSPVYGEQGRKNTISSTVIFWVLPMNIIAPALGILAVLLLSVYFGVRLYVRRTMAMMGVGATRRIVRTQRKTNPVFFMTFMAMLATTVLFVLILLILFA